MNKINILMPTFAMMLLLATSVYAVDVSYSFTLKYKDGKLNLTSIGLLDGTAPDRLNQPEVGYTLKVVSFKNEVLYSFKFSIDTTILSAADPSWFDEEGNQIYIPNETQKTINETSINLIFPYFKNAKTVDIFDQNNTLVLSIDISKYATCNTNGVCDHNENYNICPEDCPKKVKCIYECCMNEIDYIDKSCVTGYECVNKKCVKIGTNGKETTPGNDNIVFIIIGAGLGMIALVLIVYVIIRKSSGKKASKNFDELYLKYGRRKNKRKR